MNKAEILAFLNANPDCHLATVEGNKPHVRGIGIYRADENGVIFETSTVKDLYKQLSENPNVELCFNNYKDRIQVRVSGIAEAVDDLELKKEIVAERRFLKPRVEKGGYGAIAVYRVKKGVAHVWTMEVNLAPKTYIQL
jgi:pyridoxamine 5'-phosphate oxidase